MRFFRKDGNKMAYTGPQSEVDKLLASGWVEVGDLSPTLEEARTQKIKETKAEAQRRIFARYPQTKQANMQARSDELDRIESGRWRDTSGLQQLARLLTASEIYELASFNVAWTWVKSVRAASDQIEADIQASTDPANFDVINSSRWPA